MDYREFVLVTCILGVSRDLEVIEPGVACIPDVEECVQHREVRGLSESAGAGEQEDPLSFESRSSLIRRDLST